jgi:C4-type Zn-finger protein
MCGDSIEGTYRKEFANFFTNLDNLKALKSSFTLIIDDPLDNSFIQNPFYPDEDPRIVYLYSYYIIFIFIFILFILYLAC